MEKFSRTWHQNNADSSSPTSVAFWLGDLSNSLMLAGLPFLYQQNKTEGFLEDLLAFKAMICLLDYR